MKIIGYQKDFFDYMIYNHGVDNSLVLDRTLFLGDNSTIHADMRQLGNNYHFYTLGDLFVSKDVERRNLLREIDNSRDYSIVSFYFNGFVYGLYYKHQKSKLNWDIRFTDRNVYTDYKGSFHLIKDHYNKPVKLKAEEDLIKFSNKYKLPYFIVGFNGFFPMLAIKDHDKYFDATTVYQDIENFLLNSDLANCSTNEQSNDNKITSHGFDLKSSFRNTK